MLAVGIYLEAVRTGRGIHQDDLAKRVDIGVRTLRSIEHGERPTHIDTLFQIIHAIGASPAHVGRLARPGATPALARTFAAVQLSGRALTDDEMDQLEQMSPDQLRAVLDFAKRMQQRG